MKKYRSYKTGKLINTTLLFVLVVVMFACEDMIRDNFLILEEVAEFEYTIDTDDVNYNETESVNLQSIINDLDSDVEDISFYNFTLQVTNAYNSPLSTEISGTIRVKQSSDSQYEPIVNFSKITLEEFQTERSIFSDELTGISVVSGGVAYLIDLYDLQPAPSLDFNVQGTIDLNGEARSTTFDFTVRVYSQFETDP
ncbi:MAG: hypothetical protein GVY07_17050 [Bacteroidetes bacterium]|nr:hypothetical protein [Bacteroidota bacterium]